MTIDWSKLSKKAIAILVVLIVLSLVSIGLGLALLIMVFAEQWRLIVSTVVITGVTIGLWFAAYKYYQKQVTM